jgi:hypothetical protein
MTMTIDTTTHHNGLDPIVTEATAAAHVVAGTAQIVAPQGAELESLKVSVGPARLGPVFVRDTGATAVVK